MAEPAQPEGGTDRVRWLDDWEQAVWRHLLSVESCLRERLDGDLRVAHGLSLGDYEVLVQLSEGDPGGLRMSDLAQRLLLSRSGLTRRVDGLVKEGLVERRACPADGRGSMARLTETGATRLRDAAPTHVAGVRRYLIDPLGDLHELAEGLNRVESALTHDVT
ncbi:MAG: MarR family transcriptional regulator [Acidimicrobiales bacterium]|nr:MarR family transcriptional regulator [Acidimicrobiales bacterium]